MNKHSSCRQWRNGICALLIREGSGNEPRSRRPKKTDLVGLIAELLNEKSFPSCKAICRRLKIPQTTCVWVLHEALGLTKFDLRWVPHTLDADQMAERVDLSHQLLQVLRSDEEQNFKNIVTGDESWFFLETSVISGWSRSRDDLTSRPKQNIQPEKCLISIIWSPYGLHGLRVVTQGEHFNSTFFTNVVVLGLQTNHCSGTQRKAPKCWTVHLWTHPSQIKTFLRNSRGNPSHQSATSCICPWHSVQWLLPL
jgi:hypothetical protein